MLNSGLIYNNENLINIIFSYLNVKDLANISSVSKGFNRISNEYNKYWREACNEFFCSSYEQNR